MDFHTGFSHKPFRQISLSILLLFASNSPSFAQNGAILFSGGFGRSTIDYKSSVLLPIIKFNHPFAMNFGISIEKNLSHNNWVKLSYGREFYNNSISLLSDKGINIMYLASDSPFSIKAVWGKRLKLGDRFYLNYALGPAISKEKNIGGGITSINFSNTTGYRWEITELYYYQMVYFSACVPLECQFRLSDFFYISAIFESDYAFISRANTNTISVWYENLDNHNSGTVKYRQVRLKTGFLISFKLKIF